MNYCYENFIYKIAYLFLFVKQVSVVFYQDGGLEEILQSGGRAICGGGGTSFVQQQ